MPANSLPLVSVIIVNWNRQADVGLALKYLAKTHYSPLELIVVDNGSTDDSLSVIGALPNIRLLALGKNAGPCAARNAGLAAAKGEFVFFLDSDAVLSKRALAPLVRAMQADLKVAVIGCRIDNARTRKIDQWIYAEKPARHGPQSFDTYAFSAAGALARRSALLAVGGFDERLFIYNEEVDLSYRLLEAGYKIRYDSVAKVYHRPSETGRAPGRDYWRLMIRNWIWIFRRYYPKAACWWRVVLYSALYTVKGAAQGQLGAVLRGIREGLSSSGSAAPKKTFSPATIRLIDQLNRRRFVRIGR